MAGLIDAIINPAQADVIGAQQRGQQRADRDLAGEILGQTMTGKLGALATSNPEMALKLAESMGTPITSQGRIDNLKGVIIAANGFAEAGIPVNEISAFIRGEGEKVTQSVKASGGIGDGSRMIGFADRMDAGDPDWRSQLKTMASGFTPADPKQTAEIENLQARTAKTQAETAGITGEPKVDQKQVNALRKDIMGVSKTFRLVDEANERIKKVGRKGTAASDISLIFNFMKINDPGSTVREGEFATAQNAAGIDDRVVNTYNQLLKGTRLSEGQREDFLNQSQSLFDGQRISTDNQIENILQQADQDSIDRVRVFGKDRLKSFQERSALRVAEGVATSPLDLLPPGSIDNGDGTFTLTTGEIVEPE